MSVFIPITKKSHAKQCSNYRTAVLVSHASKVMLKILQARLQQYLNQEFPCTSWVLKRQKNQGSSCQHSLDRGESKGVPKNIYFCFIDYTEAFDCADNSKLRKILKEMVIPDYLTCLLRNLYCGSRSNSQNQHRTTDWFKIGKGV